MPTDEFLIEYVHRSIAATTGLLVITTMAFTLKSKSTPKGMKIASIIAGSAVLGQITLGAFVIVERLHAVLVTAHLGLGLVLFAMVLVIALYSFGLMSYDSKTKKMFTTQKRGVEEQLEESKS